MTTRERYNKALQTLEDLHLEINDLRAYVLMTEIEEAVEDHAVGKCTVENCPNHEYGTVAQSWAEDASYNSQLLVDEYLELLVAAGEIKYQCCRDDKDEQKGGD